MKKALLIAGMILMSVGMIAQEEIEVITGAGYANDVYYSLEYGVQDTVPRNNWDIAFTSNSFSSSILANHGAGVELYTWDLGDINDWDNVDTTGMKWKAMYNSIETWEEGAFGVNALGHPDYGWGIYDMVTHNLTGDSIFIIKTAAGNWKKLAIVSRESMTNNWDIKWDNLDGSDINSMTFKTGIYHNFTFLHVNLDSVQTILREPDHSSWDLLFTKYFDYNIPYSVTGVLTNEKNILAQEVSGPDLDQSTHMAYEDTSFVSNISTIGSDWKKFDMGSMGYLLSDTTVFFLKKYTGEDSLYYKIYFTGFSGSMADGKYTFMQEKLAGVSNQAPEAVQLLEVYPNPAADQLNVLMDHEGEIRLSVIDVTGRMLKSDAFISGGFNTRTLNISDLDQGLFFIRLEVGTESQVVRFIKD
jgi:hypothetical protein